MIFKTVVTFWMILIFPKYILRMIYLSKYSNNLRVPKLKPSWVQYDKYFRHFIVANLFDFTNVVHHS